MSLPKVVAFGGGHGLSATLRALKRLTDQLTAVVTVADDGGSSGRLRQEFDCLPPGDLRMALAALTGDNPEGRLWADVLQTRFTGQGPLAGHAVGNLLIYALWQRDPDPVKGLDQVGRLVDAQGRVLPMSSLPLVISAEVACLDEANPDQITRVVGQEHVATTPGEVLSIAVEPVNPPACREAVASILEADFLVFGPGSWFTSVVPHLLVPELAEAILASDAHKICLLNLLPSDETRGFTPSRHIEILSDHCRDLKVQTVIADPSYAHSDPDLAGAVDAIGGKLVIAPVAMHDGTPRHDPFLVAAILALVMEL